MFLNRTKMRNEVYRLLQYEINRIITYDKNHKLDWNVFLSLLYLCVQMDVELNDWMKALQKYDLAVYIRNGVDSINEVRNIITNDVIQSWIKDNSMPEDDMPGQELDELEDRIYYGTLRFTSKGNDSGTIAIKDIACESKDVFVTFVIVNYYMKLNSSLNIIHCPLIENSLYKDIDEEIRLMVLEVTQNKNVYDKYFSTSELMEYLKELEPDGGSVSSGVNIEKVSKELAPGLSALDELAGMSALEKMSNMARLPEYVRVVLDKYVEDVGADEAQSKLLNYASSLC